ncbi:oxoglutarate/iron-dependent dioxygenase [Artemisia annua]|uniref:Oxoglutarate/iron-dependent dioxygenase n=1 Tax=Artemisia annua TaxID=35608 RepID=A0A2U1Q1L4_ARTAN|nr:oxoglutarate/iron-dependent dioxygenase [Artemisia annua]
MAKGSLPQKQEKKKEVGSQLVSPQMFQRVNLPAAMHLFEWKYESQINNEKKNDNMEKFMRVHQALPGSHFNSLLLNRYKTGNHYVGWHADNETLYGPTPEISSVSFGCECHFLLKKRNTNNEPPTKRPKNNEGTYCTHKCCFTLKHGSLLVMRGNTQRDWLHSVPKRAKANSARINLTFRRVIM